MHNRVVISINKRQYIRNCRCVELSTVANQICDGMSSSCAADQSQSPDVAIATSDVVTATPSAPPPTPANVEDAESHDVTETLPGEIINVNGTVITAEEMDMAELKVRIACQEKANMALRMELKCAELQVTHSGVAM